MSWQTIIKSDTTFKDNNSKKMVDLKRDVTNQDAKSIRNHKITCIDCGTYYSGGNDVEADIEMEGLDKGPLRGFIEFHAQCPTCNEWNLLAELSLGNPVKNEPSLLELHEQPFPNSISPYSKIKEEPEDSGSNWQEELR
tara:strand:- start:96 stop:512 length:417 start_codon:yes stop_codon:yes gene_type:complete